LLVNQDRFFIQDMSSDSVTNVDISEYLGKICLFALSTEVDYNVLGRKDTVYSNSVCVHKEPIVSIPNVFTPDNGDEKNDEWSVYYYGVEAIHSAHVTVYSLSGQKVFESKDINFRWNGTFKHRPIPSGLYVFQFSYTYGDGMLIEQKGELSVLR